jgi:hypothetical protein
MITPMAGEHIGENDSGAVLDGHGARRRSASNASVRSVERIASPVQCIFALMASPTRLLGRVAFLRLIFSRRSRSVISRRNSEFSRWS